MQDVLIYTTKTCKYCEQAKSLLNRLMIPYRVIDVTSDNKLKMEMIEKSKQMGVPVIEIDGRIIVGSDKLEKYLEARLHG